MSLYVLLLSLKVACQYSGRISISTNIIGEIPHSYQQIGIEREEEIFINEICGISLHTPGHTPGSVCFSFQDQKLLVSGDTLFQGSIGRTDLWGGDFSAIEKSIKNHLYTLDEDTTVIPGHGPTTSIGFEMRHNAFVKA